MQFNCDRTRLFIYLEFRLEEKNSWMYSTALTWTSIPNPHYFASTDVDWINLTVATVEEADK